MQATCSAGSPNNWAIIHLLLAPVMTPPQHHGWGWKPPDFSLCPMVLPSSLLPSMALDIRQGGGDAEAGFGVDPGTGIRWKAPGRGISGALRGPHPPRPCCGTHPLPNPQKLQPALVPGTPLPPGPDGTGEGAWWRAAVQEYRGLALPHGGKAFKGLASKGQNRKEVLRGFLGTGCRHEKSHGLILDY